MKTTKQILQEAYELIGDKKRWCQGCTARTKDGIPTFSISDTAARWCGMGAIFKVGGAADEAHRLEAACLDSYGPLSGVADVNDDFGYAAIRRMFRKAIKAA